MARRRKDIDRGEAIENEVLSISFQYSICAADILLYAAVLVCNGRGNQQTKRWTI